MPLGLQTAQLNFETIKDIGQEGRNSSVFIAHDKQLDGQIVVKQIEKAKLSNPSEYYREAKILYASSHPFVVGVNYGCSDNDNIYIAMPYYKNGSLKSSMDRQHLTIREVIRYSIQFLSGLNNIHSKGLMHFDVKPDNILLSDSNEALLSDFGLAKAMDNLGFASPDKVYAKQMPPEVFANTDKTIQFDIYLAGLTIYRLLNGNNHYYAQCSFPNQAAQIKAIQTGNFPDRNAYLPHVPLKLQRVINKALNVNIKDRHKNVLELINELSDIDENLDWRYEKNGAVTTYVKDLNDRTYQIQLDSSNINNPLLSSTKTMKASGNSTKINSHSHNNLTKNNVLSKLKKALKEI
ncbi:serine/threonine protein kinase [Subsaxibacter sp. CAU 1640]|uniref:serine/threonine-protein kinase n=1 Tax=Subsaxibacter sp. CAU 1640 TaxID=2933271 RepID=UPI002002E25C|nr:serine/threonine-protein kinase [Subsaxibacter sp. CAU 1640]MCK7589195.1 serine/threonine protein kinase [Subsaxibacter sp. CAU 1640]